MSIGKICTVLYITCSAEQVFLLPDMAPPLQLCPGQSQLHQNHIGVCCSPLVYPHQSILLWAQQVKNYRGASKSGRPGVVAAGFGSPPRSLSRMVIDSPKSHWCLLFPSSLCSQKHFTLGPADLPY